MYTTLRVFTASLRACTAVWLYRTQIESYAPVYQRVDDHQNGYFRNLLYFCGLRNIKEVWLP